MEISKELLSIILGEKAYDIKCVSDNIISFYTDYDQYEEINIYELAHKCKEWAYRQGFIIDTGFHKNYINQFKANCYGWVSTNIDIKKDFNKCTEFEVVIESCQWIVNKNIIG